MIDGKLIGYGQEGLVYKLANNTALKVYFQPGTTVSGLNRSEFFATREYENLKPAHDADVPVPEPYNLTKVKLTKEDVESVKSLSFTSGVTYLQTRTIDSSSLVGKELFALHREYIEGVPLDKKRFPSISIRKKLNSLHDLLDNKGFVFSDTKAGNYVLTPEKNIYITDASYLVSKDDILGLLYAQDEPLFRATCKFEDWLYSEIESFRNPENCL